MADWPIQGGQFYDAYGQNTVTTEGLLIDHGASANTKGSWVQIVASLPRAADGIHALLRPFDSINNERFLVDIGLGASGSEVAVVLNLMVSGGIERVNEYLWLPLHIPSGQRVSARLQSKHNTAGQSAIHTQWHFQSNGWTPSTFCGSADPFGADTTTTTGVSVDPGGTPVYSYHCAL